MCMDLKTFLINPFIGFNCRFWHLLHLYCNLLFLTPIKSHTDFIFIFSLQSLHSLLLISDKLSTRLDHEANINLKLSINFSLCVVVLPLSSAFLTGIEKLIYFSIFSPKHSSRQSNSFASCLIMK